MDEKHESYGVIALTKVNGGKTNLFGSKIEHDNFIRLEINKAELYKDSNYVEEKIFKTTNVIAEVYLSPLQFSELITTMNNYSGVPCTVVKLNGKRLEQTPAIKTVKEQTIDYLSERLTDFKKKIIDSEKIINDILNKTGTLTKADKEAIKGYTSSLKSETLSNIPFYEKIAQEYVDSAVLEAKLEVEAHTNNVVHNLGLQVLASKLENNQNNIPQIEI
jgi:hypothetical protein